MFPDVLYYLLLVLVEGGLEYLVLLGLTFHPLEPEDAPVEVALQPVLHLGGDA